MLTPLQFCLENQRVLLRPLSIEDVSHLLPFSIQEPETWTYSLQQPNSKQHLQDYINLAIKHRNSKTAVPFIVFDKQTKTYAGSTRFYDLNFYHKSCSLGYTWYGKAYRGTGLNTHCKFLMLSHAFENWKLERVEFRADFNNARSIQAMKNIGATVEGVLRSNCTAPKGRRDSIVLSILKAEWFTQVKPMLIKRLKDQ